MKFLAILSAVASATQMAQAAAPYQTSKFTSDMQSLLVQEHNSRRQSLPPVSAANMLQLSWSDSMAEEAQKWSRNCEFEHFTDNHRYGQNMYEYSDDKYSEKDTINMIMKAWAEEELTSSVVQRIKSDAAANRPIAMGDISHASQILWAKTAEVGCGYSRCDNGIFVFCNYFPPGNYYDQGWYEPGNTCSKCPQNASGCNAGLCTSGGGSSISTTPVTTPAMTKTATPYVTPVATKTTAPATPATTTTAAPVTPAATKTPAPVAPATPSATTSTTKPITSVPSPTEHCKSKKY